MTRPILFLNDLIRRVNGLRSAGHDPADVFRAFADGVERRLGGDPPAPKIRLAGSDEAPGGRSWR